MQSNTRVAWIRRAAIAIAAGLPSAGSASAQETSDSVIALEGITITARKRTEVATDVPLSVSVKEGKDLATSTIDSGADLARDTPNFNFVDFAGPGGNYGTMRGIGPLGSPLNSLDNTIGFSVDGVPTSSFGCRSSRQTCRWPGL